MHVSEHILQINDSDFDDQVLKSEIPVLVDFWAEWCGPCKMIAPILEEIAIEYAGKITVAKVNIDNNPGTPQRYVVRGIPTLIMFKDGEVHATKVGALAKSQLAAFIDANL
jgi:thioredoxin 1